MQIPYRDHFTDPGYGGYRVYVVDVDLYIYICISEYFLMQASFTTELPH